MEQEPPEEAVWDAAGAGQVYVVTVAVGETNVAMRATSVRSTAVEPCTSWSVYLHISVTSNCPHTVSASYQRVLK